MTLGVDLYGRYQTVTNWQAVKTAGVTFVYVKATDGSGYANVRADAMVNGAHGVGIPVGLYHFSQPGSPETQANLLLSEVRRLNAFGVGPALDLEDNPPNSGKANIPDSQKAGYAIPFLRKVAGAGYRPVVYMNSALAAKLRPDRWDVPGLVLWIASYGPNDGRRHALTGGYPGRVDVHQFTSNATVSGVAGKVDLNEALIDITISTMEDDVSFTDQITVASPGDRTYSETHPAKDVIGDTYYWAADTYRAVTGVLVPAVTALTAGLGESLDQDAIMERIDTAVREASTTAFKEQVVPTLRPLLLELLGEDQDAHVDTFLDKLGARLLKPAA